jgi:hypothetical protein
MIRAWEEAKGVLRVAALSQGAGEQCRVLLGWRQQVVAPPDAEQWLPNLPQHGLAVVICLREHPGIGQQAVHIGFGSVDQRS